MLFALPWRDLKLLLKHAGCKRADIRAIRTQWRARRSKMLTNVQNKILKVPGLRVGTAFTGVVRITIVNQLNLWTNMTLPRFECRSRCIAAIKD